MSIDLRVNTDVHTLDVDPECPLLWVIRDNLGLTGTKYGCGVAQCGACTVHIDGQPVRSCTVPVGAMGEADVTTIEALTGAEADAVTAAWIAGNVPQCGYCQSGQIMSAVALLRENASPSDDDIEAAMSGNLCRCCTYFRIHAAIREAARMLGAGKAA